MKKKAEKNSREKFPPAYFLSLTVENVRCFGPKQTLDLSDGNDRPAQWTVILGNNGTGKTTLLQCLAMLEPAPSILEAPDEVSPRWARYGWQSWAYPGKKGLRVSGSILSGARLTGGEDAEVIDNFEFCEESTDSSSSSVEKRTRIGGLVCYGYGAARRIGRISLTDKMHDDQNASLFDDDAALLNAEEWLLQLDYAVSKTSRIQGRFQKRLGESLFPFFPM